ncbi:MAG: N-acetylmuramic acid 6-phosphate etherase [Sediminibacterium sp.]|nr:N-acetylmuramic acid 6-phosphate etherase [Sediminibacterium sp.]
MNKIPITETDSIYQNIDKMSIKDVLINMNLEDKKVALAVQKTIPIITQFVENTSQKIKKGGRLFYMGAGTSGRLGVLDASEIPPTFGVINKIIGIIAGGETALRSAVENAEDNEQQGWQDLLPYKINKKDTVLCISANGSTPYLIGALKKCTEKKITTACIVCNKNTPMSKFSNFVINPIVGPEFVTGSTRLKSGTAQKMVLNMISTSIMIYLGKVEGNKMVNMQLKNKKLIDRGVRMLQEKKHLNEQEALNYLLKYKSVKKVLAILKEK